MTTKGSPVSSSHAARRAGVIGAVLGGEVGAGRGRKKEWTVTSGYDVGGNGGHDAYNIG